MSMQYVDSKITKELRRVTNNKKAYWQEWSTSKDTIRVHLKKNEKMIHLSALGIWVAYLDEKAKS